MKIKERWRSRRPVDEMKIQGLSLSLSDRPIAVEREDGGRGPQRAEGRWWRWVGEGIVRGGGIGRGGKRVAALWLCLDLAGGQQEAYLRRSERRGGEGGLGV